MAFLIASSLPYLFRSGVSLAKPDDVIKRVEGKELGKRAKKELGVGTILPSDKQSGRWCVWVTYLLLLVLFELLEDGVEVGSFWLFWREPFNKQAKNSFSFVCLLPHQKTKQKRVSSSSQFVAIISLLW